MITGKQLEDDGFKRYGNWWLKDNVSINLFSKTIQHTAKPNFMIEVEQMPVLDTIKRFSNIMKEVINARCV